MSSFGSPFVDPSLLNGSQLIFQGLVYGYILFEGANYIGDGSELLLLVPSMAGLVGSVVLPVLGAVPDGMMILFSGMKPGNREEIMVGVGTLAGSTVMLLTATWFVSVLGGRVNLSLKGRPFYKRPEGAPEDWEKLYPPGNASLFGTGVGVRSSIRNNVRYMFFTMFVYPIAQLAGMFDQDHVMKQGFLLFALLYSMAGFVAYLRAQYEDADESENVEAKVVEATLNALDDRAISLQGALGEVRSLDKRYSTNEYQMEDNVKQQAIFYKKLGQLLRPYFKKFDVNGDSVIDFEEFRVICAELSHTASRDVQLNIFKRMDVDKNGTLCFDEFVDCMLTLTRKVEEYTQRKKETSARAAGPSDFGNLVGDMSFTDDGRPSLWEEEDGEDDDEDEDTPEDLAHLSPEEQQRRIKLRAAWLCGLGTFLVLVFSDPMVDILAEMGQRINVNPFFVSFVLSPIVSNASELFASYRYAKKRTVKTITISLAQLEGAACMNNTFSMGVLLFVLLYQDYPWEFAAEGLQVVLVELVMCWIAYTRQVYTLFDGVCILGIYPASLFFVYVMRDIVGWS